MNNILDRTKAPIVKPIGSFNMPTINEERVHSTSLFSYKADNTPLVKIDVIVDFGTIDSSKAGLLSFYNAIAKDETTTLNHTELNEKIAFYGAAIEVASSQHKTTFSLYSLTKYAERLIPILFDIISSPSLSAERIELLKEKMVQSQLVQEEKTSFWNSYYFSKAFFKEGHSYGFVRTSEDLKAITREELVTIKDELLSRKAKLFISGSYDENILSTLKKESSRLSQSKDGNNSKESALKGKHFEIIKDKEDSVQSSLKAGFSTINRAHQDYEALFITNMILGGYFGSRLMQNIREEKGYTYGIYSQYTNTPLGSHITIGADVIKKHNEDVVSEIKKEIELLQQTAISELELNSAREYIKGKIINSVGTAFQIMEKFTFLHYEELPVDYYSSLFTKIDQLSVQDILSASQQHLTKEISYSIYG